MPSERQSAVQIVNILQNQGHTACFAGGCVRDIILHRKPKDYDIATSALPQQVEAAIPNSKPIGKSFGVIQCKMNGFTFEVATFRHDHSYSNGRHPDKISFSCPRKDAMRRDFTVNAVFYDPISKNYLDFVHGLEDIKKGVIRCVGSPSRRFREDHLRLLRAIRFSSTLTFKIVRETQTAIRQNASLIRKISPERIREELTRILTASPRPGTAFALMNKLDLFENVFPVTKSSCSDHQLARLFRILDLLGGKDTATLLTSLMIRTGAPQGERVIFPEMQKMISATTSQALHSLHFSNRLIKQVLEAQNIYWLLRSSQGKVPPEHLPELTKSGTDAAIQILTAESKLCAQLRPVCKAALRLTVQTRNLIKTPLVKGKDLQAAGIESGPVMGLLLQKALVMQAQGRSKMEIMKEIRKLSSTVQDPARTAHSASGSSLS